MSRAIEEALLADRAETLHRMEQLSADHVDLVAAAAGANADDEHDPEGTTLGFERSQVEALVRQAREHLHEIDDALRRMEAGTFGTCERCGQPIPAGRLEARPFTRWCVTCATR